MPKTKVLCIEISVPPVNKEKTYIHVYKVFKFNKINFRLKRKSMNKRIDYAGIQCFSSAQAYYSCKLLISHLIIKDKRVAEEHKYYGIKRFYQYIAYDK